MEIVPCSKVGHIYKNSNVYSFPKGKSILIKYYLLHEKFLSV